MHTQILVGEPNEPTSYLVTETVRRLVGIDLDVAEVNFLFVGVVLVVGCVPRRLGGFPLVGHWLLCAPVSSDSAARRRPRRLCV
jgi:hypothetical protein